MVSDPNYLIICVVRSYIIHSLRLPPMLIYWIAGIGLALSLLQAYLTCPNPIDDSNRCCDSNQDPSAKHEIRRLDVVMTHAGLKIPWENYGRRFWTWQLRVCGTTQMSTRLVCVYCSRRCGCLWMLQWIQNTNAMAIGVSSSNIGYGSIKDAANSIARKIYFLMLLRFLMTYIGH